MGVFGFLTQEIAIDLGTANTVIIMNDKVVVDDCRFRNEAQLIKNLGGALWYVERPGVPKSFEHASEGSLNNYEDFDCAVFNDGAIEDLTTKLRLMAHA